MLEQRRYPRIRFVVPQPIHVGRSGQRGRGTIENLSLTGLMLRSKLETKTGEPLGCEFSILGSPAIDLVSTVVSRLGDLTGVRFTPGPLSQVLISTIIDTAIGAGKAAVLSFHEAQGSKRMRVSGGLTTALRNDFLHGLHRMQINELDLSGVTLIDHDGAALCVEALNSGQLQLVGVAACVRAALAERGVSA